MNTEKSAEDLYECGMCGIPGGPQEDCELCNGSSRFLQKRHFTLSEERMGKNKDENASRYGRMGDVMPRIVNLPGTANPPWGNQPNKPTTTEE
jgi:hypothetical protein